VTVRVNSGDPKFAGAFEVSVNGTLVHSELQASHGYLDSHPDDAHKEAVKTAVEAVLANTRLFFPDNQEVSEIKVDKAVIQKHKDEAKRKLKEADEAKKKKKHEEADKKKAEAAEKKKLKAKIEAEAAEKKAKIKEQARQKDKAAAAQQKEEEESKAQAEREEAEARKKLAKARAAFVEEKAKVEAKERAQVEDKPKVEAQETVKAEAMNKAKTETQEDSWEKAEAEAQDKAEVELKGNAKGAAEEKPEEMRVEAPKLKVGAKAQVTVAKTEDTVFLIENCAGTKAQVPIDTPSTSAGQSFCSSFEQAKTPPVASSSLATFFGFGCCRSSHSMDDCDGEMPAAAV